jgi:hypothetical protein
MATKNKVTSIKFTPQLKKKLLHGAVVIVAMEYTNRYMFNDCIGWWENGFDGLAKKYIPHQWLDMYSALGKAGYKEYMNLLIEDYHYMLLIQFEN